MRPILVYSPLDALAPLMLEVEAVYAASADKRKGDRITQIERAWNSYFYALRDLSYAQCDMCRNPTLDKFEVCLRDGRKLERVARRFLKKFRDA